MRSRSRQGSAAWEAVDMRNQEKLYAAYSELHRVAQKTEIPIAAPVVTVVGHQTDGKSALIEALMGFQFNHVGGGTKTRRPVKIEMVFDADADTPECSLALPEGDQQKTLEDLKAYIESENVRLGDENRFDRTDIIVQIRYKLCPNLTIIDTPGLMSIPDSSDNEDLKQASRQVEEIVREKISQPESINLCLEDNSDWVNATTRLIVLDIDPHTERTVLVSTKFDSRISQFATSADVEAFLHPTKEQLSSSSMLGGGPFFTSVPSGRVGDDEESTFASDEDFDRMVKQQEKEDQHSVSLKLRRALRPDERCHIGVSNLRKFLETELLQRYKEHIDPITRFVNAQTSRVKRDQEAVESAQKRLGESEVKDHVRSVLLAVQKEIAKLLSGDACLLDNANCGQTLQQEWEAEGQLVCTPGFELKVEVNWERHVHEKFGDRQLYGGAQYFRVLDEFREFVSRTKCPTISGAEMDNKCGLGSRTDAPNITSVAAQLAADKAERAFEPLLQQLGLRVKHVLARVMQLSRMLMSAPGSSGDPAFQAMDGSILDCIQGHYTQFLDDREVEARTSALDDLKSRTHFVTLGDSNSALQEAVRCDVNDQVLQEVDSAIHANPDNAHEVLTNFLRSHISPFLSQPRGQVVQEAVPALTRSLFVSIRKGFIEDTVRKFNYKLLQQVQEGLPEHLQKCLDQEDLNGLCDTQEIREELQEKQQLLEAEMQNMQRLKTTFGEIKSLLRKGTALAAAAC